MCLNVCVCVDTFKRIIVFECVCVCVCVCVDKFKRIIVPECVGGERVASIYSM